MLLLIVDNVEEVGVILGRETSSQELRLWHGAHTLLVEDILEMLKLEVIC